MFFFLGTFLVSLITALSYNWQITLIMLAAMPLMSVPLGCLIKIQTGYAEKEMKAYETAGATAEEALSAIRTVTAFGGQQKEIDK